MNIETTLSASPRALAKYCASRALLAALIVLVMPLLNPAVAAAAHRNVVADWNEAVEATLAVPAERGPRVPARTLAIMHAAMFDAANGIERKYEPLHVTDQPPPGANAEAAAIQAAYTVLTALRGAHQAAWDHRLAHTLANLPGAPGNNQSIARGRAWGESVAHAILAWRAADGTNTVLPPFVGSTDAGYWRHAPLGSSPTAGYVNLAVVPFLLDDPAVYDPGPPYGYANRSDGLSSAEYAADVNDVEARGGVTSAVRTAEELDAALFNDACDVASLNRLLRSLVGTQTKLVDSARSFALFNMAAFDTTVVFFRAKYNHAFWRPFQAINYANEDNNAATEQDANWAPYLSTPPHPEYPSAHVTLFTALLRVADRLHGTGGPVELTAAASAFHPGGVRVYDSLEAVSDLTVQSRVLIGYHFLQTGLVSQIVGRAIGDDIVDDYLQER